MFEKMKIFIVRSWTLMTTPEKDGCLKRVHVTRHNNKFRKMVVYYPKGDRLPEYEVIA